MRGEQAVDELFDVIRTVEKLHDPDIATIVVDGKSESKIYINIVGDPTETIYDVGLGLIDVDHDCLDGFDRFSVTDINGVEVVWVEKKAPNAATSEAN